MVASQVLRLRLHSQCIYREPQCIGKRTMLASLGLWLRLSTYEPTVTLSIQYMEASTMEHIITHWWGQPRTGGGGPGHLATDGTLVIVSIDRSIHAFLIFFP